MKKYKLWIRFFNILECKYSVREEIIETNDIYHSIGYIYCHSIEDIKRIDYVEISEGS